MTVDELTLRFMEITMQGGFTSAILYLIIRIYAQQTELCKILNKIVERLDSITQLISYDNGSGGGSDDDDNNNNKSNKSRREGGGRG